MRISNKPAPTKTPITMGKDDDDDVSDDSDALSILLADECDFGGGGDSFGEEERVDEPFSDVNFGGGGGDGGDGIGLVLAALF